MADEQTLALRNIRYLIREALTKTDKAEIKTIVCKELESELKSKLAKAVKEEVTKALKDKSTKEEMGEISKQIIKKLYKDLSLHHPYIIDRIKV
jgi:rRNA maturation endonuclease Nob1